MEREEPRFPHRFVAERAEAGVRLDGALARRFPALSRSRLQRMVKAGFAKVNGSVSRPGRSLVPGDEVEVLLEVVTRPFARPEKIPS